ncbi:MAG: phosphoenolpyruvate--protein phosphotransferase [Melioribacteraceae bacterium]|nr:phosphoenolpyruvate--protein phosphotransferase [Melioribacteraceae bacterium]MCF8352956.1 phosphoenolpyruvate--protein phosphotransferase [Melioribacteraceae bacterium]MCF8395837.1 phosphoenolpyruvate--protein phosphotransferase [Melioribacteraceae bacterium]MCF8417473.1 phosphoenolpyruvate--protein phosphotransferase [Melioribacteraceae bacterium]
MNKQNQNILIKGIGAAPGISFAKVYLYAKEKELISDAVITDVDEAIAALHDAIFRSKKELNKIFDLAVYKLGEKRAAIFEAQIMILDDPVLINTIKERIKNEKKVPEYIVHDEITKYQDLMNQAREPYMKERSQDIEDIKNRIIRNLKKKRWQSRIEEDVIVIAKSLTPADTVLFSRVNAKGFACDFGGLTSHAAIVARSLNIPAVVGLHDATAKINADDNVIVDGFRGEIIINPSTEVEKEYLDKIIRLAQFDAKLSVLKHEPAVTTDGREIDLMANLDLLEEIEIVKENGADGIGLVRTEQIFSSQDQFPDEDIQYETYLKLADDLAPNKLIIRVFDIGGDKVLPFDVKEPNPFLGWRGIRFLLDNKKLFKTQLRAILRASMKQNILIMIPMISSIAEIRSSKLLIEECRNELRQENVQFDENIKVGIMVEVPSAAVMAGEFAEEVDFISIGTNDLIQYLLAVDRGNEIVSNQYQEFHPAVIRTIRHIIKEGKNDHTFVSMCGEMAGDTLAVPLLVGLGLDSISVSPAMIPIIKKIIRSISYSEAKSLADKCLIFKTEKEISNLLQEFNDVYLKDAIQKI